MANLRHGGLASPEAGALAIVVLFGALFLPLLSGAHAEAFPLNGVAWSLSHELLANLGYGRLRRPSGLVLAALSAAGALGCIGLLLSVRSVDVGGMQDDYLAGLCRVLFAFPAGVLLHRAHLAGKTCGLPRLGPIALAALLAAPLAIPQHHQTGDVFIDAAAIFLVFPSLLACAARCESSTPAGQALGQLSYPLYVIHIVLRPIWLVGLAGIATAPSLVLVLAGSLVCALGLQRGLETPIRWRRLAPA